MPAESSSHPTIFLVPGAFHTCFCFESLSNRLRSLSHLSVTYTLPSIASVDPFTADAIADGTFIRSKVEDLIEADQDVLLVAHSYAGIPGAAAAYGLSKEERQSKGKKGGVIGLVFISAVLTKEGESCIQKMGGVYPSYSVYNENTGEADLVPHDIVPTFLNDVSEPVASAAASTLRSQAGIIFATESSKPAWAESAFHGRCVYLRCKRDVCIPVSTQDALIEASGVDWKVMELDAGHCPFFSMPDTLAKILVRYADDFSNLDN